MLHDFIFVATRVGGFLKTVLMSITNATVRQLNYEYRFSDTNPVVSELSIVIILRALMKNSNGIGGGYNVCFGSLALS